jgi:hypothetical protein
MTSNANKAEMMTRTDSDRIDRLERALAQLAAGVDWSTQRGGRDSRAFRDICSEQDAIAAARTRDQRRDALRAELAGLGEAA